MQKIFAISLFYLLEKAITQNELLLICGEYPGWEAFIKQELLNILNTKNIDKNRIKFGFIGKKSNAHGTGTEQNDLYECQALKRIFGEDIYSIFITSQKGALGHALGAASTIELISTILSVNRGIIPPTAGLSSLDTAIELKELNFPTQKTEADIPVAIKEAIGFGGHNYVVAVSKGCY